MSSTITTNTYPQYAFITAAGIGSRLRPYTDNVPKPLVEVQGRPILDYIFDELEEYGIKRVVLNKHYLADTITAYIATQSHRPFEIITLYEEKLLDTGGGIKTGLPYFDNEAFFAVSGDSFWSNGKIPALKHMAQNWNPEHMDLLLMLQPHSRVTGYTVGDYDFVNNTQNGPIKRSHTRTGTHMWTSVRICTPSLFNDTADNQSFSFLEIMDKAENNNRIAGLEHDGEWYHISTPEDLDEINALDICTLQNVI